MRYQCINSERKLNQFHNRVQYKQTLFKDCLGLVINCSYNSEEKITLQPILSFMTVAKQRKTEVIS